MWDVVVLALPLIAFIGGVVILMAMFLPEEEPLKRSDNRLKMEALQERLEERYQRLLVFHLVEDCLLVIHKDKLIMQLLPADIDEAEQKLDKYLMTWVEKDANTPNT